MADIATIRSWAAANPHRDATLKVPSSLDLCPEHTNYVMDTYKFPDGAGPWQLVKLDPAGLVSFALWLKDPLYKAGEGLLRRQLLNEGHISLRASFEAAAPSRKRRRLVELFENIDLFRSAEAADLRAFWETWATVLCCQFVQISSRGEKRISFVPEDLSRWSSSRPVYYVDEGVETIFLPPKGDYNNRGIEGYGLAKYVADRMEDGWTVNWPIAEGTKEELEQELLPILNFVTVSEKAKKAELAAIIGRHRAIEALQKFSLDKAVELI